MDRQCCGEDIKQKGQAALIVVVLVLFSMLALIAAAAAVALGETRISELEYRSKRSYFTAESGLEDAVYRLVRGKTVAALYTLPLGGESASVNITTTGTGKEVSSNASVSGVTRAGKVALFNSVGASFRYGLQVGYLGLHMKNQARVIGSVFSNGNIVMDNQAAITGDAWVAGGTATAPDQQQIVQTEDLNVRDTTARRDAAQSFVPSITADARKIELYIKRTVESPGDAAIRIVADQNGRPAYGDPLASGSLSAANVTTSYGWVEVALTSDDPLMGGSTYWLVMDSSADHPSKYYVWGGNAEGDGNNYAPGTFKYSANWSDNFPSWTPANADSVFKIYLGDTTTSIDGGVVGENGKGDGHANTIKDASIAGDAYYQTIINTTVGGVQYPGSSDPAPRAFPVSDAQIAQLKAGGDAGGECARRANPNPNANPPECDLEGDLELDGNIAISVGPIKIPRNMMVQNQAKITMNGTIHVGGSLILKNDCVVKLHPSYGARSGAIVADGTIELENNCDLLGSGVSSLSYMMILTTSPRLESPPAMKLKNHASSAIFYASEGAIELDNQSALKEAVGQMLKLQNTATVTYETGLRDITFSSGSSGGWAISGWEEIVP